MKIEVLYFEGCPNHQATVSLLKDVSKRTHLETEIEEIEIKDLDAANAKKFLGSPTVRVNGLDIEPSARFATDFGMMCRVYERGDTRVGVPPEDLIRRALEEATGKTINERG